MEIYTAFMKDGTIEYHKGLNRNDVKSDLGDTVSFMFEGVNIRYYYRDGVWHKRKHKNLQLPAAQTLSLEAITEMFDTTSEITIQYPDLNTLTIAHGYGYYGADLHILHYHVFDAEYFRSDGRSPKPGYMVHNGSCYAMDDRAAALQEFYNRLCSNTSTRSVPVTSLPTIEWHVHDDKSVLIDEKIFTIYWLDGRRIVISGQTIEDAFTKAGYGLGAVRAVDWYDYGITNTHTYDKINKKWVRK